MREALKSFSFLTRSRKYAAASGVTALIIVGLLDYITGIMTTGQLGFSIFYLIPIFLYTWHLGFATGVAMSLLSATSWYVSDYMSGRVYLDQALSFWNAGIRLGFFLVFVYLLSGIKEERDKREKLIHELQEAMAKIRTLKGLIPICAWCHNIRDDKGYWNQLEEYIMEHSDVDFTHGICPACIKKIEEEGWNM